MVDAKTGRESSFRTGFSQIAASLTFAPLVISQAYSIWARRLFRGKREKGFTQKCLKHRCHSPWCVQNGPYAATLDKFCSENFPTFSLSYWGSILNTPEGPILRKEISPKFKIGWYREHWVPGAFKLDHFQPFEPILLQNISNFFTFILGAHSYYPRGPIMRKGNSPNFKIGWVRGDWMLWAFKLDHLQPF